MSRTERLSLEHGGDSVLGSALDLGTMTGGGEGSGSS